MHVLAFLLPALSQTLLCLERKALEAIMQINLFKSLLGGVGVSVGCKTENRCGGADRSCLDHPCPLSLLQSTSLSLRLPEGA